MKDDCGWDDDTYLSFIEDDTPFGPEGIYGWLMNMWFRIWA